jgi:hypothetical protein
MIDGIRMPATPMASIAIAIEDLDTLLTPLPS